MELLRVPLPARASCVVILFELFCHFESEWIETMAVGMSGTTFTSITFDIQYIIQSKLKFCLDHPNGMSVMSKANIWWAQIWQTDKNLASSFILVSLLWCVRHSMCVCVQNVMSAYVSVQVRTRMRMSVNFCFSPVRTKFME